MRTARSAAPQYRQQLVADPVDAVRVTRDRSGRARPAGNRHAKGRLPESRSGESRTGAVRSVANRFAGGPAFPDHRGSSPQGDVSARSVPAGDRGPWTSCGEVARTGSVGAEAGGVGRGGPSGTATAGTAFRTGRDRVCTASPRSPRGLRAARRGRRSPVDRVLVGVAVALCSAAVVVVLGLVADLAAASHAGGDAGPRTVQQVERAVPTAPVR